MSYAAIGPKRPRKKPKPKTVSCANDNFAFIDGDEGFNVGVEIFVCTNEEENTFEPLESGTYFLSTGDEFSVTDGVITNIV